MLLGNREHTSCQDRIESLDQTGLDFYVVGSWKAEAIGLAGMSEGWERAEGHRVA